MRLQQKIGLLIFSLGAILFALVTLHKHRQPKPLWAGARYTDQDRDVAVERGLQFINQLADNPRFFAASGSDVLFCFYTISNTAKNEHLRAMALAMGQQRARQWRRESTVPPTTGDVNDLHVFISGTDASDKLLGETDEKMKQRIREAVAQIPAIEFLDFDAAHEPRLADIPQSCTACKASGRPAAICHQKCTNPPEPTDPYGVWLDALITTYTGDTYGVKLGASYPEVLRWIVVMRPYPVTENPTSSAADPDEFSYAPYAVTHVIYTVNDYGRYRLSPTWMPQEFDYLEANIRKAEENEDGEVLGEFMDTLRSFGRDESSPEIQVAMDYLLAHQNSDGSWGDPTDENLYNRYHATWTAVDGLRQYAYQDERLRLPEVMPLMRGTSNDGSRGTIKSISANQ